MRVSVAMRNSFEALAAQTDELHVAPIDLKHLRRYTLGDPTLEREILGLFIAQLPITIAALSSCATPKDWHIAAHTLKGSARAVGAWRIARIAEQAEHAQISANSAQVAHTVSLIEDAASEARAFIAATYPA